MAAVFIFGYIFHEVLLEKEEGFDNRVAGYVSAHIVSSGLTRFMKGVTIFGSQEFLFSAYVLLVLFFLFFHKNRPLAIDIATIGISGYFVTLLLKILFHRARPSDPLIERLRNYSFPSGHSSSGFIFYGFLAWLVWNTHWRPVYKYSVMAALILFSLLIGCSRVYLRIHYASDVIAGFCVGFTWLLFSVWLLDRLKNKYAVKKGV
jgi:undecaprenyl-diphosphatase